MNLKAASLAVIAAGSMLGASQANAGGKNVYFQVGWANGHGNHFTISNRPNYGHGGYAHQPVTYVRPVRHHVRHVQPVRYVKKHRKHIRSHWKPRHRQHWRGNGHHRGHKVAHRKHHGGYNRW